MHKPLLIPVWLVLLVVTSQTEAKYVPSFNLADVAWNATHILLVTEGDTIDGKVQVLEVWKGALERQQWITIPELVTYATPESREIYSGMSRSDHEDGTTHWWKNGSHRQSTGRVIGNRVTGHRMVVFLRHQTGTKRVQGNESANEMMREWLPASSSWFSPMQLSLAWIEGDRVFVFGQPFNPGPIVITSYRSLPDFRATMQSVLGLQANLSRAISVQSPTQRALSLRAIGAARGTDLPDHVLSE